MKHITLVGSDIQVSRIAFGTTRIEPKALRIAEQWMIERRLNWERRLDRLVEYLASHPEEPAKESLLNERSVTHANFAAERTYDASPARVFAAGADHAAKARWFAGPAEWAVAELKLDFRVGGQEIVLLDGHEASVRREHGTGGLLDALRAEAWRAGASALKEKT